MFLYLISENTGTCCHGRGARNCVHQISVEKVNLTNFSEKSCAFYNPESAQDKILYQNNKLIYY